VKNLDNLNKIVVRKEICRIFVEHLLISNCMKSFNTTGPCDPQRHYMLPLEERLGGAGLSRYIDEQLYWVLHAQQAKESPWNERIT
jgi:hypothetical protein